MTSSTDHPRLSDWARTPVLAVAAAWGAVFLLTVGRGSTTPFNEPYFAAAGKYHFGVTYADQPVGVPLLARLADAVHPDSLLVLRLSAVLVTLAGIVVASLLARELGGGTAAQVLAAAMYGGLGLTPGWTELETTSFDPQLWIGIVYLLVRWINRPDAPRRDLLLLGAGVLTALALQVKYLVPVLWVAVIIGVLSCGPRRMLLRPALWTGGVLAVAATVPALLWQARNGWPQLGMTEYLAERSGTSPLGMLTSIALVAGPLTVLLVPLGLYGLVAVRDLRPFRFLAVAAVVATLIVLFTRGRPDYVDGLVVPVAVAGLVVGERLLSPARHRRVLFAAAAALLVAVPVTLGAARLTEPAGPVRPAMVDDVARAAAQHPGAPVVADSYETAAKLEYFGPQVGLRPGRVFSPHLGYWYFGAPSDGPTVLYAARSGDLPDRVRDAFGRAEKITESGGSDALGPVTIWRLSEPRRTWAELWPDLNELRRR